MPSPTLARSFRTLTLAWFVLAGTHFTAASDKIVPPDWSQPGSATHQQVPPPADFRRPSKVIAEPIGVFEGRADVGSALVEGSATFDPARGAYTIHSAGYNIWYHRDEFQFLWKKMSGDVSLAADIAFPDPDGYFDRKVVLIIRQDLDDDSKEIMVALHGGGLIHLAKRPTKAADLSEDVRTGEAIGDDKPVLAKRLGIEKRGNEFTLYLSRSGEPMQPFGKPSTLDFSEPFYVGIGFCSHLPVTSDTAIVTNVALTNRAGDVK